MYRLAIPSYRWRDAMTYLVQPMVRAVDLRRIAEARSESRPVRRPGFLRRLFDTVMEAQQRRAYRDIERVVAGRAGLFTDSLEREIGEHMSSGNMMTRR